MHPDSFELDPDPVFAWKADGHTFAMRGAEPVAQARPAREQIRLGRAMLASAPAGSKLAGALPFDLSEPGSLWVGFPEQLYLENDECPRGQPSSLVELAEDADRDFTRFAREALQQLELGVLSKVVASRRFRVQNGSPFRPIKIFSRLSRDRAAAAFLCQSRGGTLVGASPEILVQKQGVEILSTPLAGSRSRALGDYAQATDILLHSEKDLREHQLVVDQILAALQSAGASTAEAAGPFVLGTERIWHLATDITGVLDADDTRDSLKMVELLHPTPAVCGTPSDRALEYIRHHEVETRGLYAGAIGWQDQNGDGQWRVTLRCGLIDGNIAHVASGAGLVAGSEINEELSETKHKAMTFIDAL